MDNRIRPYAWGSRTAIAELIGAPSPAQHPQAELWMGAHPGDPSVLLEAAGERSLLEAITDKPVLMLGERVEAQFGPRLPFLFKVLAAAEPLSLQAHPSAAQAARGFRLEESAGVPMSANGRNYKDGSHKPELICALTEFHALCGFRDPVMTVELLAELGVPQLDHYLSLLSGQPDANGVRALFSSILTIPSSMLEPLLASVLSACVRLVREGSPFTAEYRTALELGERYPGDPGVLAALLLNRVTLAPGQALFLAAGNLHAYLAGVGVELMANSDNVLRGGLTPKYVDVPELMRVLDFSAGDVEILSGDEVRPGELVYRTPVPEFRLARLALSEEPLDLTHDGPQVVLVVEGSASVVDGEGHVVEVPRGRSIWIAAGDTGVRITGSGIAFRATDGL
ncbi:mannose-6-phosphate isomerase [Nakamurella sp. UYEF19]|uniref:mannose-6-phosphate isomerase, class I n=1 Tax=Nakamurella sp. UYEF19 TaxID=1756392 RepID=UPI003394BF5D